VTARAEFADGRGALGRTTDFTDFADGAVLRKIACGGTAEFAECADRGQGGAGDIGRASGATTAFQLRGFVNVPPIREIRGPVDRASGALFFRVFRVFRGSFNLISAGVS
jgi:hypothetical protein